MTDPYAVTCPACLAEPGRRCSNRIRELESVHWSRMRLARQRRAGRSPVRSERAPVGAAPRGGRARSG
jgi:hypothetical protein